MKKSVIYRLAQYSVLNDASLKEHEKLEILRALMGNEELALFSEQQEEKAVG